MTNWLKSSRLKRTSRTAQLCWRREWLRWEHAWFCSQSSTLNSTRSSVCTGISSNHQSLLTKSLFVQGHQQVVQRQKHCRLVTWIPGEGALSRQSGYSRAVSKVFHLLSEVHKYHIMHIAISQQKSQLLFLFLVCCFYVTLLFTEFGNLFLQVHGCLQRGSNGQHGAC